MATNPQDRELRTKGKKKRYPSPVADRKKSGANRHRTRLTEAIANLAANANYQIQTLPGSQQMTKTTNNHKSGSNLPLKRLRPIMPLQQVYHWPTVTLLGTPAR